MLLLVLVLHDLLNLISVSKTRHLRLLSDFGNSLWYGIYLTFSLAVSSPGLKESLCRLAFVLEQSRNLGFTHFDNKAFAYGNVT
jgi:hypothetical protein